MWSDTSIFGTYSCPMSTGLCHSKMCRVVSAICLRLYHALNPSMELAENQSLDATLIGDSEMMGPRNQ